MKTQIIKVQMALIFTEIFEKSKSVFRSCDDLDLQPALLQEMSASIKPPKNGDSFLKYYGVDVFQPVCDFLDEKACPLFFFLLFLIAFLFYSRSSFLFRTFCNVEDDVAQFFASFIQFYDLHFGRFRTQKVCFASFFVFMVDLVTFLPVCLCFLTAAIDKASCVSVFGFLGWWFSLPDPRNMYRCKVCSMFPCQLPSCSLTYWCPFSLLFLFIGVFLLLFLLGG